VSGLVVSVVALVLFRPDRKDRFVLGELLAHDRAVISRTLLTVSSFR